jgi:predicted oxidoreductase
VRRGQKSSRTAVGEFALEAPVVLVTSGGIGANHELVRANWPERLGTPPQHMISGVPDHVDGRMLAISQAAGANVINEDRMWHYTEGVRNWDPIWTDHGIRIIPGPSSLWLDATGHRLPPPLFPGFDTLGTLAHIMGTGHDHTWFVLTQKIIEKEFALSGSEQNPDITGRDLRLLLKGRLGSGAPEPVEAFKRHGADFVVERDLQALVRGMNALTPAPLIDHDALEREIVARDREVRNPYTKDLQLTAIHGARRFLADRVSRIAAPHRILDPKAGPLIAVRLSILTRKSLGGLQTDLSGRVLTASGEPLRASTPRARSRASAAAACTATARSKEPSSGAACSPAARRGARPRQHWPSDTRQRAAGVVVETVRGSGYRLPRGLARAPELAPIPFT